MRFHSKTLAILSHTKSDFNEGGYFLSQLVEEWKKQGMKVVFLSGVERFVPADALIMHLDLTVVPKEYRMFANRYSVVINRDAIDISKRLVSTNLVHFVEDYDGTVIVKTNRNAGGGSERKLKRLPGLIGWLQHKAMNLLPWSWSGRLKSSAYPIFESAKAVPWVVWNNPLLVVEKFLPERQEKYYCLRQWVFFGDREINLRCFSTEQIIKGFNVIDRQQGLPVPPELRKLRERLGFDYGKFDYGIVDGKAVLYDVNRTTTFGKHNPPFQDAKLIAAELAQGITAFLE